MAHFLMTHTEPNLWKPHGGEVGQVKHTLKKKKKKSTQDYFVLRGRINVLSKLLHGPKMPVFTRLTPCSFLFLASRPCTSSDLNKNKHKNFFQLLKTVRTEFKGEREWMTAALE